MSNVSEPPNNVVDLTTKILENIRDEIRTLNNGLADVRGELQTLNARVDSGFAELRGEVSELRGEVSELRGEVSELRGEVVGTNRRLDSVLKIAGTHHTELEDRVSRIEQHLGLSGAG